MDRNSILKRLDEERRALAPPGVAIERLQHVTRIHASDGSHHGVIYSCLTSENSDAVIEQEIEHYRRLGVSFEWKAFAHDGPADLVDRLIRHGLTRGPCEAVMVYDLSNPPVWVGQSHSLTVVRADRLDQVDIFARLAAEIFEKDYGFTAAQLADAIAAGSFDHRGYIAYAGDVPAAIGRLYTDPRSHFGGLYGGGTLREFRGRGMYRATVAARARDALNRGAKYLIVDALPTSRPILERLGFEHLTDTWPCEFSPVMGVHQSG